MTDNIKVKVGEKSVVVPGLHDYINNDDYHRGPGISKSQLCILAEKTPQHFIHEKNHPREPSKSMTIGSALHCLVLEPEKFEKEYIIRPNFSGKGSVKQKQDFAIMCEIQNLTPLSGEDHNKIVCMRDSLMKHPVFKRLVEAGRPEVSGYWIDKITGELLRIRPDFLPDGMNVCLDLKTAKGAAFTEFSKDAAKYHYHVSHAMYCDGLYQITGEYYGFLFAVVESEPPFCTVLYELDHPARALGHTIYRRLLDKYIRAKDDNFKQGYPEDIRILDLPAWAKHQPIV